MKTHKISTLSSSNRYSMLLLSVILTSNLGLRAADNAAADRLMADAKAKQTHALELRAAATAALQKAADDQMEATVEERDARILTIRALNLLKADANKQRAFASRYESRKAWLEAHRKLVEARNAEQKAAQLKRNADELAKAAAELKDQPFLAGLLDTQAKEQLAEAQSDEQTASRDKADAHVLEGRSSAMWATAEKLDPEGTRNATPPKGTATVAPPRPAK